VDSQPPNLKNDEEGEARYKGVGIDEHEKVVDVFVRLVLVQSASTPYIPVQERGLDSRPKF
jgi:hypothetical protein